MKNYYDLTRVGYINLKNEFQGEINELRSIVEDADKEGATYFFMHEGGMAIEFFRDKKEGETSLAFLNEDGNIMGYTEAVSFKKIGGFKKKEIDNGIILLYQDEGRLEKYLKKQK